jgi:hypothetical protein
MSGSSGGGGGGGGSSGGSAGSGDCNIIERVPLNSPQAAVVSTLKVNQQLNVALSGGAVVALDGSNNVAGSLTPRRLVDLIDCMNQGRQYVAVVLTIRGALCEVEIRPRA